MSRTIRSESYANDQMKVSADCVAEWRRVLDRRDARAIAVRNLDRQLQRANRRPGFILTAAVQSLSAVCFAVLQFI